MRTNTKAVLAGGRLGDHWGTGTFWALAMIIYVQHLQICYNSEGTVKQRQVLICHNKVYGENNAESAFRDAHK